METCRRRLSERTIGRKERVCGHMGVKRMAGMEGWTREPPADNEYAVEPVIRVSCHSNVKIEQETCR